MKTPLSLLAAFASGLQQPDPATATDLQQGYLATEDRGGGGQSRAATRLLYRFSRKVFFSQYALTPHTFTRPINVVRLPAFLATSTGNAHLIRLNPEAI